MEYFFANYYAHTNLIPTDIYPVQYGEEQCKPAHHFGPCVRNNYLIHYIYSGSGIFRINGKEYTLKEGQLFLIPPNISTYYRADSNSPWLYRWVEFNGSMAQKLLSDAGLSTDSPILADATPDIGDSLKTMVEKGDIPFEPLMSLFWKFLASLKGQQGMDETSNNAVEYIQQAETYIKNNLHKSLTVHAVADYIGIDRSYLCRLFTEHKGMSPKQYMDILKMQRAVQYLKLKNISITEIAFSLGYCDCHAFHKAFRKHYGCSPSSFRQKSEFEQTIQNHLAKSPP